MKHNREKNVAPRHGLRWQDWERDYLHDCWGLVSQKWLARRLGRRESAVYWMARELGLTLTQNFLTASDIARIFGVHVIVPIRWITQGLLSATKQSLVHQGQGSVWRITEVSVHKFMQAHPDRYDVRKINREEYPFIHELARKVKGGLGNRRGPWTSEEDAFLLNNNPKLTLEEMRLCLNRTRQAVACRLARLRKEHPILHRDPEYVEARRWTEAEVVFLKQNWNTLLPDELARQLNRHEVGVLGKGKRIGLLTSAQPKPLDFRKHKNKRQYRLSA